MDDKSKATTRATPAELLNLLDAAKAELADGIDDGPAVKAYTDTVAAERLAGGKLYGHTSDPHELAEMMAQPASPALVGFFRSEAEVRAEESEPCATPADPNDFRTLDQLRTAASMDGYQGQEMEAYVRRVVDIMLAEGRGLDVPVDDMPESELPAEREHRLKEICAHVDDAAKADIDDLRLAAEEELHVWPPRSKALFAYVNAVRAPVDDAAVDVQTMSESSGPGVMSFRSEATMREFFAPPYGQANEPEVTDPLATPYAGPVCADCEHAIVPDRDADDPDMWTCSAVEPVVNRPERVDSVTGETYPAIVTRPRCLEVNGRGQCTMFDSCGRRALAPISEAKAMFDQQGYGSWDELSDAGRWSWRRAAYAGQARSDQKPEPQRWYERLFRRKVVRHG